MDVKLQPNEELKISKDGKVPLVIRNDGGYRVAFKTKSTRPNSLKMSLLTGFIEANSSVQIDVAYKPTETEGTLKDLDHLSVLTAIVPADFNGTISDFWNLPHGPVVRRSIRLVIEEDRSRTVSPAPITSDASDDGDDAPGAGSDLPEKTWSKLKQKKDAEDKKVKAKRVTKKKSKKSKRNPTAMKEEK